MGSIRSRSSRRRWVSLVVVALAGLVVAAACVPFTPKVIAGGGTEQVWVETDANVPVQLLDAHGHVVPTYLPQVPLQTALTRTTDAKGRLILRYLKPGKYRVRRVDTNTVQSSDLVKVTSFKQNPPQSFYATQKLTVGYGYIPMRDGRLVSAMIRLPGPPDQGPYPTVIEYSGYDPANPDSPQPSERLANALGFATVGVNLRGTGCSDGGFQLWEHQQSTDGYDIVEAVAAQPWVLSHKVGLVGISFPAITSLFAAQTQPPHLEAIAPVSVFDDAFRNLLRPGGILNQGFTVSWLADRTHDSQPTPNGQPWATKRVNNGDAVCAFNQQFRPGQNFDVGAQVNSQPYYPTELGIGDSLAPRTFVHKINVPVFLAGAWQDEQTGAHFATMLDKFTSSPSKHFYLVNGAHTEGYAVPEILSRWWEFLEFYVAHKIPDSTFLRTVAGPVVTSGILGAAVTDPFPPDRFTGYPSYAAALAAYEAEPVVHVLFDNGAGTGAAAGLAPGVPAAAFERDYPSWPIPGTTATTFFLGSNGVLGAPAPTGADGAAGTIDSYVSDPSVRPAVSLPSGNVWGQLPAWNWTPVVDGKALSYITAPLATDTVMAGTGSVNLWLRSSAADTDLQVTLSEVRPDGMETYVQAGWMRASERALDPTQSTTLNPVQSMLATDVASMPAGGFVPVRIALYPFAHAFRTGSRIRITIEAPGGDRPVWTFGTLPGTQTNDVAHSLGRPSAVVLPVVAGPAIPTPLPPCPSLRGEPCRTYVAPPAQP